MHRSLQKPLLEPQKSNSPLTAALQAQVLETLAQLAPGSARSLLSDMTRIAQDLLTTVPEPGAPEITRQVSELMGLPAMRPRNSIGSINA